MQLAENVENLIITGKGANLVTGNKLANIIKLGPTGASVDAGAGHDVIVGGAGADVFNIVRGNGSDAIVNFQAGWDVIKLKDYGIRSFDMLLANAQQTGNDVTFTLSGEKLVLRDVALSSLGAADFNLPMDNLVPSEATHHFYKASQAWNSNGWYVHTNAWGKGGLVEGKDFAIEAHFGIADMTDGTTFHWSFPLVTEAFPQIRAYPQLIYGTSPLNGANAVNPTDKAHVFPARVGDLVSLTATHDVSYSGNLSGFNIAYDIWLANSPNGGEDAITNEVMIWVHKGGFDAYGTVVGSYVDAQGNTAKIYNDKKYTAVVFDNELPAITIDIKGIFDTLEQLGIVKDTEYVRSLEVGAEVVSGSGSLTFHNMDIEVSTRTESGGVLTKLVTGTGTEVTEIPGATPPAEVPPIEMPSIDWMHDVSAGTKKLKDVFGKDAGKKTITVDGETIHAAITNAVGRVVGTEKAKIVGDKLTVDQFDAGGKKTGSTVERHDADGAVWVETLDEIGALVGVERIFVESATAVTHQFFNARWELVSADRVLTKADGSTAKENYGANFTWLGYERSTPKADGSVVTQFFDAVGKHTGTDIVARVDADIRTTHYSASGVIQTIDIVRDLGGGVIKEITVDAKWNGLYSEIHGTDGADQLWGAGYKTDFFGGLGKDILGGGTGVDRFHYDLLPAEGEADQIRNFEVGRDKVVLHADVFTALDVGALDPGMFRQGKVAREADDHILYDKARGELYYDADGSGSGAAVLLAQLMGNPVLTAGNFTIIA